MKVERRSPKETFLYAFSFGQVNVKLSRQGVILELGNAQAQPKYMDFRWCFCFLENLISLKSVH